MAKDSFGKWLERRRKSGGLTQEQPARQSELIKAMEQASVLTLEKQFHLH